MTTLDSEQATIDRAGYGLRWLAIALCFFAGTVVAALSWTSAQSDRERQSLQRAEALAQSFAARISSALALGIPFDRLQGVETAFAHALHEGAGVQSIALTDGNDAVVRRADTSASNGRMPATLAVRAPVRHTDARGREEVSGSVIVYARQIEGGSFAWEICMLVLAAAALGAVAVSALWEWALRRGPAMRLRAISRARQLAAEGDWTVVPDAGPSHRNRWIHLYGARVRALAERYQRIHRLAASLASTEPNQTERDRITSLHEQAQGIDRFPAKTPDHLPMSSAGRGSPMKLKTRLTASITAVVIALGAMAMLALVLQQRHHAMEIEQALLGQQSLGWDKIQAGANEVIKRDAEALAAKAGLAAALATQDRARLAEISDSIVHAAHGRRVDFYDARGQLAYTSSIEIDHGTLLESEWRVPQHAKPPAPTVGVTLVPRHDMFWFASLAVRDAAGKRIGMLALADPVGPALQALGRSMNAQVLLASSRGRQMRGVGPQQLALLHLAFDPRYAQAQRISLPAEPASAGAGDGRRDLLVTSHPVTNPDGRTIGQLVVLRDQSEQMQRDRVLDASTIGVVLLMAVGIALGLSRHLQRAFGPLRSSVAVLAALADGRATEQRIAPWDERRADEAGAIARGVSVLREKVLDLAQLREERQRLGEQQERLIRHELHRLAETIDAESRTTVLGELAVDDAQENQLARLSKTLGNMTSLISSQHSRLLDVLRELQASLATRALFESLQRELEIARNMQQSILPRGAPDSSAVDVCALMVPAKEVGGDFYDYFVLHYDGMAHLVVVVADVSGKGIPAALFMAITRTLLKGHARLLRSPSQTLAVVNDELADDNEQMMFVTIFMGVINLATGEMTYVNAGHNPPALRRGRNVTRLEAPRNMALGVAPGLTFAEGRVVLERGQQLLLYTDGVTEAVGPGEVFFGEGALFEALRDSADAPSAMAQTVLDAVRGFADQEPQADDITCVVVEYRGTP